MMRGRTFAAVAAIACSTAAARAQPNTAGISAESRVSAEALFDEAMRRMEAQKYTDACPMLEQSERLDPAVGTLLYLAHCYEALGRNASAWVTFRTAAAAARDSGQPDRAKIATEYAEKLKPTLSKLVIEMHSHPDGLELFRDGRQIDAELLGIPVPVDAGHHTIEARAPGFAAVTASVDVGGGAALRSVTLPALVHLGPTPGAPRVPPPQKPHPTTWPGWLLSGIGVACIATGAAVAARRDSGTVATVFTGVGGASLGGGIAILVLPRTEPARDLPPRRATGAELGLSASW